jgi:hypothetical protein
LTRATRSWVSQELNPYGLKDATAGKGTFPKMKSDRGDKAEAPESALFDMLVNINDHMKVIRSNLASIP